jgi:UDP-glucose 4-epimerase
VASVLITGAAGFLGRAFVREFASQGWRVSGVDNSTPENAAQPALVAYLQSSLPSTDFDGFLHDQRPDLVVHSAGRASVPLSFESPSDDFRSGPALTAALLETIRRLRQPVKVLFCSSAAVYGEPRSFPVSETACVDPISPYGFHKYMGEQLCLEHSVCFGIPTAVMRIFSAYGPGLRRQVVYDACRQGLNGCISLYGTGSESRDFIHARDVARAAVCIATNGPMNGEVYNVASGVETTIATMAELVKQILRLQVDCVFASQRQSGMPQRWLADIGKIKSLGFEPAVNITDGIDSVVRWCAADAGQDWQAISVR